MPHRRDKNDPEFLDRMAAEVHEFPIPVEMMGDLQGDVSVQDLITGMMEEAVNHYHENLEPEQVRATDYYYGRPFGDEEDGRSQAISTDIKDVTNAQMPGLLKIFMGSENVVDFKPQNEGEVLQAQQQTDYVNLIVREDNPGYLIFQNAFKDALVRKVGFFKWWWEDYDQVRAYEYQGISEQAIMVLMEEEDVDDVRVLSESVGTVQGPEGLVEVPIFDVRVMRFENEGRARFAAVPPEEVVWTPDARDFESSGIVAHTRRVTVDEAARVTGLDPEDIQEFAGLEERPGSQNLQWARQFHGGGESSNTVGGEDVAKPLSQQNVLLSEVYAEMDLDGDDISELRMFHCLGPMYEIVNGEEDENGDFLGEIVNEVSLAFITPEPEPHTIVGLCNYDNHKDIQEIKSQVRRGMLNSLGQAIDPQMEVVATQVNMKDVLNPEISNIIRTRRPGMIKEIKHTFLGAETIAIEEHFNDVRADRGGTTRAAEGLDPNSLQSSTQEAVSATLNKAQERIESIARTFAETGVKRLYKGLLGLVIENQDQDRVVELRGQFVEVDPRSWNVNTDVKVNAGLGTGSLAQKTAVLSGIATDQQALKAEGSPLVSNVHIRNTRKRLLEVAGFTGSTEFYAEWGQEQEQQLQEQIANTPPPPDPAMELVEIERVKAQLRAIEVRQKNELEQLKAAWEDDFKRDKLARDSSLKEAEIEAEFQTKIADLELKNKIADDRQAQTPNEGPA